MPNNNVIACGNAKKKKASHGFSLIEVLIALLILVVGISGIFKMQVYVQKQAAFSLNSIHALNIAESKLELFAAYQRNDEYMSGNLTIPPLETVTLGYNDIISGEQVEGIFELEWQVEPMQPSLAVDNIKLVTITVKWRNNVNKFESIELKTAIANLNNER